MAPAQSKLLTLPTELRLEILGRLIVEHELELRPQTKQPGSPLCFSDYPLTQTCRQLCSEITEHFRNTALQLCSFIKEKINGKRQHGPTRRLHGAIRNGRSLQDLWVQDGAQPAYGFLQR